MTESVMTFFSTSIGKKVIMAVSGVIFFGFVIVHILGNLQLFLGAEQLNAYAHFLQSLGAFKWVIRGVVLLACVLHIVSATQVTLQSWAARPQKYVKQQFRETTYAARTMRWSGPVIGLFVIYHLLHLTTGHAHPMPQEFIAAEGDIINVFNNVVYGFQVWWTSAIYIIVMLMVGLHLYHGVWSMLQTVGLNHLKWNIWRRVVAVLAGLFVAGAGVAMPVAVLLGFILPVL